MVRLPTPTQEITHPLLAQKGIRLFIKRDDLIHSQIMGNKWRKLKYNLAAIKAKECSGIVTMGGAYSNHIAATAALAKENNLQSVGIIRGEELDESSNPTLKFAHNSGMKLKFVGRSAPTPAPRPCSRSQRV